MLSICRICIGRFSMGRQEWKLQDRLGATGCGIINPNVQIEPYDTRFTSSNAQRLRGVMT